MLCASLRISGGVWTVGDMFVEVLKAPVRRPSLTILGLPQPVVSGVIEVHLGERPARV
jgi:hypothetical protein